MTNTHKEPYFPHSGSELDGHNIDAGNQTLMRQAPMTANEYLHSAIDCIDAKLGQGYAKAHPELVGAFIQASAVDLGTAVIARAIESLGDSLAIAIKETEDALRSDHPLQGESFAGIDAGLQEIAHAISERK